MLNILGEHVPVRLVARTTSKTAPSFMPLGSKHARGGLAPTDMVKVNFST
jgi:hypothetical protein